MLNPPHFATLESFSIGIPSRLEIMYFRDGEFIDGLLYAKVQLPH
jgi:hypothetical protein